MSPLRCVIYGSPGTPVFEIAEKLSEFHQMEFLAVEKVPVESDSYFDDKIPEVDLDMGDFSSGSASQHMVRDPYAIERDKVLDGDPDIEINDYEGLDKKDLGYIFRLKQGIIATDLPEINLIRWSTHVIYLYADEKDAIEWFRNRRKCPTCGNIHHLQEKPPKIEGVCDRCGTDLIMMDTDKPDKIKKQFKNWRNEFWRFQETAKLNSRWRTFNIDKFSSFHDLLGNIDLYLRDNIENIDNWYGKIKSELGSNPFDGPFIWNPAEGKFEKK
jgi:ribosomal protein S27AE